MKIKAKLQGLCCANCAAKIEDRIGKLDGVEAVTVSFLTEKMILVAADDKADTIKAQAEKIVHQIEPDVKVAYL